MQARRHTRQTGKRSKADSLAEGLQTVAHNTPSPWPTKALGDSHADHLVVAPRHKVSLEDNAK